MIADRVGAERHHRAACRIEQRGRVDVILLHFDKEKGIEQIGVFILCTSTGGEKHHYSKGYTDQFFHIIYPFYHFTNIRFAGIIIADTAAIATASHSVSIA